MWEFLAAEVTMCQPTMRWDGLKRCPLWDAFQRISITSQGSAGKECWGKDAFLNQCYSCPGCLGSFPRCRKRCNHSVSINQCLLVKGRRDVLFLPLLPREVS